MDCKVQLSEPSTAIEIKNTSKRFPKSSVDALSNVSLSIPRGALVGLLGPNGAGKSTLINILGGLTLKTAGRVVVWGRDIDRDPRNARAAIGVVPQEINMDPYFTPWRTLSLYAGLYGLSRAQHRTSMLLEQLELTDKQHAYARTLSGGMKRRLLLAKAMVHNPPILVLDEPTAGVDLMLRKKIWQLVSELHKQGTTILLTTHYLEEAESLCERIAIINHGRIVAYEKTADLLARISTKSLILHHKHKTPPELSLPSQAHLVSSIPYRIEICYNPNALPLHHLLDSLSASGLELLDMQPKNTALEEVFLQLTTKTQQTHDH